MIRLFLHICKAFHKIKHLDEHTIYSLLKDSCTSMPYSCPSCHAPASSFRRNGSYQRHLVSYSNGFVCGRLVTIHSSFCASCKHSHALLPSLFIPYSSYSIRFLISLLYARITGKFRSVVSLCGHFDISESTYYRIRKYFVHDSKIFMDAVCSLLDACQQAASLPPVETALSMDPAVFHEALSLFFFSTGRSFLQPCIRLRPNIHCWDFPPGYHQIP